jgi:hypothetical protein
MVIQEVERIVERPIEVIKLVEVKTEVLVEKFVFIDRVIEKPFEKIVLQ